MKINKYKEKIVELADKLLEKEKECSRLSALKSVHEMRLESLDKELTAREAHLESLDKLVQEKQFEINGLHRRLSEVADMCIQAEKQRDNWKADCEYNEQCFQAEREARYRLEDEIKVLKGEKKYPCISLECNDITGESSSLYFCFSYDDRVLLANNVPGNISQDKFIIKSCYIDSSKGGLIYEVEYLLPQFIGDKPPYNTCKVKFEVSYDLKKVINSCIPRGWNNYCNDKSNKDIRDNYFQRYCFLGVNNRLYACVSADEFILLLDMHPENWIQESGNWKIWYDDKTKEGLVHIYDKLSLKTVNYYIEGNNVKKVIGEQV